MYENEPRMLGGQPLSTMVGIMGAIVLLSQVFALSIMANVFLYFFQLIACFCMIFILNSGTKKRKLGNILSYIFFLIIYIFWASFTLILFIWLITADCIVTTTTLSHHKAISTTSSPTTLVPTTTLPLSSSTVETTESTDAAELVNSNLFFEQILEVTVAPNMYLDDVYEATDPPCQEPSGSDIAYLIICIIICLLSMLLSIYQCRLCFLLYKVIQRETAQRNHAFVTYQNEFGNMPPAPPRYTPPNPLSTQPATRNSAASSQDHSNLPEKPPGYEEALSSSNFVNQLNPSNLVETTPDGNQQNAPVDAPSVATVEATPITSLVLPYPEAQASELDLNEIICHHPELSDQFADPYEARPENFTEVYQTRQENEQLSPMNPFNPATFDEHFETIILDPVTPSIIDTASTPCETRYPPQVSTNLDESFITPPENNVATSSINNADLLH